MTTGKFEDVKLETLSFKMSIGSIRGKWVEKIQKRQNFFQSKTPLWTQESKICPIWDFQRGNQVKNSKLSEMS